MRGWAVALLIVAALIPGISWLRESGAVDSCLDRGGSYDYRAGRCDFAVSHAFEPGLEPGTARPYLIWASGCIALVGLVLFIRGGQNGAVA